MPKANDQTLPFQDPNEVVNPKALETLPYQGPQQKVTYTTEEFSAVCPFSGLPDVGRVEIHYVPSKQIVELKSLKYYFLSYRNAGIYQEDATARIYQDLQSLLKPHELTLTVTYQTRGGIDTTTSIKSSDQPANVD